MPIVDFDPTNMLNAWQRQNANEWLPGEVVSNCWAPGNTITFTPPEPVEAPDWGFFTLWLTGYLAALEGKELKMEDIQKILEKLAAVDPTKRYPDMSPFLYPAVTPAPTGIGTTTDGTGVITTDVTYCNGTDILTSDLNAK